MDAGDLLHILALESHSQILGRETHPPLTLGYGIPSFFNAKCSSTRAVGDPPTLSYPLTFFPPGSGSLE